MKRLLMAASAVLALSFFGASDASAQYGCNSGFGGGYSSGFGGSNVVLTRDVEPGQTIALLNVGASVMSINIVRAGIPLFTRDVSVGGNQYTDANTRYPPSRGSV